MGMGPGMGSFEYPEFLMSEEEVQGVKGTKQSKL